MSLYIGNKRYKLYSGRRRYKFSEELPKIVYYTFRVNPTPSDATVIINGVVTREVTVESGTNINWTVERNSDVSARVCGYIDSDSISYERQSGNLTLERNETLDISLNEKEIKHWVYLFSSDPKINVQQKSALFNEILINNYSVPILGKGNLNGIQNQICVYDDNYTLEIDKTSKLSGYTVIFRDYNTNNTINVVYNINRITTVSPVNCDAEIYIFANP